MLLLKGRNSSLNNCGAVYSETSTLLLAAATATIAASCCCGAETAKQLACFVAAAGAIVFSTNYTLKGFQHKKSILRILYKNLLRWPFRTALVIEIKIARTKASKPPFKSANIRRIIAIYQTGRSCCIFFQV